MNPLKNPNFIRLTDSEIANTCVCYPRAAGEDDGVNRLVACDMAYYRACWPNGVETIVAMPRNQHYLKRKQYVAAYCSAVAILARNLECEAD